MAAASGKEIAKHRVELEAVLRKIMAEHTERCAEEGEPCQWQCGWAVGEDAALPAILCDLEEVMERYHVRVKALSAPSWPWQVPQVPTYTSDGSAGAGRDG